MKQTAMAEHACDEERVFRRRCARTIRALDTALAATRHKRALVIRWDPDRKLGAFGGVCMHRRLQPRDSRALRMIR